MILFFFIISLPLIFSFFFFNDTATTEIYTLSLHDALPILNDFDFGFQPWFAGGHFARAGLRVNSPLAARLPFEMLDRKSTRLNSSHVRISYAVFCLKKKKR